MTDQSPELEAAADDPEVSSEEIIYRRLSSGWAITDQITGERRPMSGAFKPDPDGVSVYGRTILLEQELTAQDLIVKAGQGVAEFQVGELRSIGLGIVPDPWPTDIPEPDHKRNAAHALVKGLNDLGSKQQQKRRQEIASLSSMRIIIDPSD